MKKIKYFILVIVTIGFCGCLTSDRMYFPVDILISHLKIVNYPTNSNNYILGAGSSSNDVDFVLRDCFTNDYIFCTDSLGNIKDYIVLYLGEGYNGFAPNYSLENIEDLFKEDGNEYYVKIYIARHKKIDYNEQQSKQLNYLDTIEVDIDDYSMTQHITFSDDGQSVWYKGRRIPSYRLLHFSLHK